jgi:hypothetical protein
MERAGVNLTPAMFHVKQLGWNLESGSQRLPVRAALTKDPRSYDARVWIHH